MKLPKEVVSLFNKTDLIAFGTADKSGFPNVIAVFWKKIIGDDKILLLSKFMKMTRKNLAENKKACISFWHPKTEEGYKIKGLAKFYEKGKIYDEGKNFLQLKQPNVFPSGVVEIIVKSVYTIKPGPNAGKRIA